MLLFDGGNTKYGARVVLHCWIKLTLTEFISCFAKSAVLLEIFAEKNIPKLQSRLHTAALIILKRQVTYYDKI